MIDVNGGSKMWVVVVNGTDANSGAYCGYHYDFSGGVSTPLFGQF
jgi:hypothetical protein